MCVACNFFSSRKRHQLLAKTFIISFNRDKDGESIFQISPTVFVLSNLEGITQGPAVGTKAALLAPPRYDEHRSAFFYNNTKCLSVVITDQFFFQAAEVCIKYGADTCALQVRLFPN